MGLPGDWFTRLDESLAGLNRKEEKRSGGNGADLFTEAPSMVSSPGYILPRATITLSTNFGAEQAHVTEVLLYSRGNYPIEKETDLFLVPAAEN